MGTPHEFSDADHQRLEEHGISLEDAERQIRQLLDPPPGPQLDRACTQGDGIEVFHDDERERLIHLAHRARQEGRITKFVPASGAATRMFKDLSILGREDRDELTKRSEAGDDAAASVLEVFHRLREFGFFGPLVEAMRESGLDVETALESGDYASITRHLLTSDGLDYSSLPKGLLHFHAYGNQCRTAFEEHLAEAAAFVSDEYGVCRLHFTVSPEHQERFEALLAKVRSKFEEAFGVRYEIGFSVQKPSTDTIAIDLDGHVIRDDAGQIAFRPGGHGALIENLKDLGADIVHIKNIDNIVPENNGSALLEWRSLLVGRLLDLQTRVFGHLRDLHENNTPEATAAAGQFLQSDLSYCLPDNFAAWTEEEQVRALLERLHRPIRVCGVVRNKGEPGGGPFWVQDVDGSISCQIVESAQVSDDAQQQEIFGTATHFNPVEIVCGLRTWRDRPFALGEFADAEAVFVAQKSKDGRALKALERPGLWNGAMADWITVFVEVPLEIFQPVKTVNDLLRPAHQVKPAKETEPTK